ncbi:MAG: SDR family oxidoreductase [Sterolibacterium sp.]
MNNKDHLFDVGDEIVVITGAAGQLGTQYCRAFLDRGARVVGLDLKPSAASEMLTKNFPKHFHFQASDVTRRDSLDVALANIEKHFGTPTVLINNAAIDSPPDAPLSENGQFEDYPDDSWDRVMNVNVKGVYLCCKVFGAAMAKASKGSIINVSSIYGVVSPDQSIYDYRRQRGETFYKPVAYSVSKSALLNLTRYLAVYWARQNVRVNTLVIAGVFNNQEDAFLAAYCGRIPVGRMARRDEYDGAVLFLAGPASSYMTGSTLSVDGGWTAI